jgi:large subunit ribosomal protein L4
MAEIKAPLYSDAGARQGEVTLDPTIFGIEPNHAVMHQVVTAQLAAKRSGTAKVKTRAEVRGGGRKPWRQKGLGRARQGSIRSPQWVGGGVVHGPQPRDFSQRTPKKMKRLAVRSALSARASEGAVAVVDRYGWETPKTKLAVSLLQSIGFGGKVLVVVGAGDTKAARSYANLPDVIVSKAGQINTYDVLWADGVVFTQEALGATGGASFDVSEEDFVKESEAGESAASEEGDE